MYNIIILYNVWQMPSYHSSLIKGVIAVLITIYTSIKSSPFPDTIHFEQLFVLLSIGSFKPLIGAVYLTLFFATIIWSPHFPGWESAIYPLISIIYIYSTPLLTHTMSFCVVIGGYNLPHINWNSDVVRLVRLGHTASGNLSAIFYHLVDYFSFLNLFQLNQVTLFCMRASLDQQLKEMKKKTIIERRILRRIEGQKKTKQVQDNMR